MNETLTITDNRTGRRYEVPVSHGCIQASDLRQIRVDDLDPGLMSYDPAFMNTASCTSRITCIDGDRGILLYRGYPIEQLAEHSSHLEVAYLLLHGELPTETQRSAWVDEITHHTFVHENVRKFIDGFHYDAHPMGIVLSSVGALSTFYPSARNLTDPSVVHLQIVRLIAKMPTMAAFAYRHSVGMPYVYPDNNLSYTGNFLNMLFRVSEPRYSPHPVLERALDVLFMLHADHEQNASTNAIRAIGSTRIDPISAMTGAIAALYGPLHGGASEEVLRMLESVGRKDRVPDFIKKVKSGEANLAGFGHRVYRSYDPRAKVGQRLAEQVVEITGRNPLLDIALELERIALQDDHFVSQQLYPNVDFYSGLIYQAMGFPKTMFPVLFAIGRTAGWLSQWKEMVGDSEQKIARPRQVYLGHEKRDYLPMADRMNKELMKRP